MVEPTSGVPAAARQPRIVALSGPVGAGKSTLASALASSYGAMHLRTLDILHDHARRQGTGLPFDRRALQEDRDPLGPGDRGTPVAPGGHRFIPRPPDSPPILIL